MKFFARCAGWAALLLLAGPARSFELMHQRSVSESGQFVVYCDDLAIRLRITGFAEEVKKGILTLLHEKDRWKFPIVININPLDAAVPEAPVSQVRILEVEDGFKVELDLRIGTDPRILRLEQQIVRTILLEYAQRNRPPIKAGEAYSEPSAWLVEGIVEYFHSREAGIQSDIFKRMIDSNRAPELSDFLVQRPEGLDSTSLALYRACALSCVKLLIDLPEGPACLAAYIADPSCGAGSADDLKRHFPTLALSAQSLQKWWTLGLARLSAAERYKGLSIEETGRRLDAFLSFQIPVKKGGEMKQFAIGDFKEYMKIRESRDALKQMNSALLALRPSANPQLMLVVTEYGKIADELAHGKTRGIRERLDAVENYRGMIVKRIADIEDYMNWFEATQMTEKSDAFDDYLKTAGEGAGAQPKRQDAISRYMDGVELEFQ